MDKSTPLSEREGVKVPGYVADGGGPVREQRRHRQRHRGVGHFDHGQVHPLELPARPLHRHGVLLPRHLCAHHPHHLHAAPSSRSPFYQLAV